MSASDLTAAEAAALIKAANLKEVKAKAAELTVGDHRVSFAPEIDALLRQGKAFKKHHPHALKPWRILCVALDKINGVTLDALLREADNLPNPREKEFKTRVEEARDRLWESTLSDSKGILTAPELSLKVPSTMAVAVEDETPVNVRV